MPDTDIIEAEDIVTHDTALVRTGRRSEVIRPLNADALVDSFRAYQDLLPRLLTAEDWQDAGRGERFVKKSGWRKIATAFDLDVQIIRSEVDRDEHGVPMRAEVIARAIAPSGRSMDGDGYCSAAETRFTGPRGNRSKLENDLRATATTRAMNRAISGLVGMGAVSAEEVDAGPAPVEEASPELKRQVRDVIALLVDADRETTSGILGVLAQRFDGHLPAAAGEAILLVGHALNARALRNAQEALKAEAEPTADDEEDEARAEAIIEQFEIEQEG